MHLTVEEALSIYPLSEAKLIAGARGKHRIVKSINVMDAPDISDWIKEGEMLLTTAYLIKDSLEDASALLQTLNRRGSSALGIKLGRFWDTVPEELIAEAETLNFPLIELPFQFTFSDQMNGLFRAELSRSTSMLQEIMEKQRKLMRFALRSGRSGPLFESVSEVIGYKLAVVSSRGDVVYNNSEYASRQLLEGWPWQNRSQRFRIGDRTGLRFPLMQGEKCSGYLLYCHIDPLLLPVEESLFIQGAELISFHIHSGYEDYFELAEHREFSGLLRRCLSGGLSCSELSQAALRLGVKLLHSPFQVLLTETAAGGEERQRELLRLKEEYAEHPALRELNAIHVLMDEGLVSLFPANGLSAGQFRELIYECFDNLKLDTGYYPRAAASAVKVKPEGLKEAFAEVRECMAMSQHWGAFGNVVHYRQLELNLLLGQIPEESMKKYITGNLRGLLSREPEYVKEMLHTLEVYLENDGHVNETAKKLFIHRNTATYRIEKLSELLDVDFKKINDLMRLKLVFVFRKMLERE
ncbi:MULTISPECIES: PucR family transcriptional regulator [unclassified Paenibacillus]|uniref:PucR family transcriptional regulator n=1 Tax=unclassified Paenibacillus TaxID=185978 RepID=UPI002406CE9F|nr:MULTISPECIES: PucR family transcriptional regulator [unclassified Paenibacillus]MDF9843517.1 purine catabolism regulator [Paenibacillus sp. PastF-2]MDF9850105.1 purine catabolism regulator [Paenibacillus sp. PastM-2]MDF9857153.1 purine catabolism regulator [Paenibacillus sp. PastF-1]MDH6482423.1 purine catabolism regulator [Paenibacillus sp. PastH-2]MDH6509239.1 purine catabolism regulator [Paenibacillus sp. PastM-3]